MSLQQQIKDDMKQAMRDKNSVALTTLRSVLSAFTNELVAQKRTPQEELGDDDALAVIKREAKKRKDAIDQFTKGDRLDLAESEQGELDVLATYLPTMMTIEQIIPIVKAKMDEMGVTDKSGMGKLIGAVMAELKDQADGGDVKTAVEDLLS